MTNRRTRPVLILGAAMIVMGIANIGLLAVNIQRDSSNMKRDLSDKSLIVALEHELNAENGLCAVLQARAFSSGYLYGWRNLAKAANLPLPIIELREANKKDRLNTSANGFKVADKYEDD